MTQPRDFHPPERRVPPPKLVDAQSAILEGVEGFFDNADVISASLLALALRAADQPIPDGLSNHLTELAAFYEDEEPPKPDPIEEPA